MASVTYKKIITDCADAYRTATGTVDAVQVGELSAKIGGLEDVTEEVAEQTLLIQEIRASLVSKTAIVNTTTNNKQQLRQNNAVLSQIKTTTQKLQEVSIINDDKYIWQRLHPELTTNPLEVSLSLGDNEVSEFDSRGIAKFLVGGKYGPIQTADDFLVAMNDADEDNPLIINYMELVEKEIKIANGFASQYNDNSFSDTNQIDANSYDDISIENIINDMITSLQASSKHFAYFVKNDLDTRTTQLYEIDVINKKMYYIPFYETTMTLDGIVSSNTSNKYKQGICIDGYYYISTNVINYIWKKYEAIKRTIENVTFPFVQMRSLDSIGLSIVVNPDEPTELPEPEPPTISYGYVRLYPRIYFNKSTRTITIKENEGFNVEITNKLNKFNLTDDLFPYVLKGSTIYTDVVMDKYVSVGNTYFAATASRLSVEKASFKSFVTSDNPNGYPQNDYDVDGYYYEKIE